MEMQSPNELEAELRPKIKPANQPARVNIVTIPEVIARSRLSRSTVNREIARTKLRTFKLGRRRLTTEADLERWLVSYGAMIG